MEEHLNSLAATHLLQHTLRNFCIPENSQWVYAVFWRILPRIFPPPKWDSEAGTCDRSIGNRRNWILAWEDGFCNFAASATAVKSGESTSTLHGNCENQRRKGLRPDMFFKMSHEIHSYGEGLIGKVAADRCCRWIYKEENDQELNLLPAWHKSVDSHPRTWEAQFQSGIETIALISVREGVLQLGAVHKIIEDLSYVVLLRKKFSYIESIPGALLPHPSSSAYGSPIAPVTPNGQISHNFPDQPVSSSPYMTSLEAFLSKLPSVVPGSSSAQVEAQDQFLAAPGPMGPKVAEEEFEGKNGHGNGGDEESGGAALPPLPPPPRRPPPVFWL